MQLFAKIWKTGVVTEALSASDPVAAEIGRAIEARARRLLGRAVAIREVDAGSCNGCEIEITGLTGPVYDMERYGLHFVASPRHADMLLVTGPVDRIIPVDVTIAGCPPEPAEILRGILHAFDRLAEKR